METNVYLIDRTTMEAVRGGLFRGFLPGDRMMIAISRSTNSSPDKEGFWVSWAGQLEFYEATEPNHFTGCRVRRLFAYWTSLARHQ